MRASGERTLGRGPAELGSGLMTQDSYPSPADWARPTEPRAVRRTNDYSVVAAASDPSTVRPCAHPPDSPMFGLGLG